MFLRVYSMARPDVSVIMPVFNTGELLLAAVRSILDQEPLPDTPLPSLEILVVDDSSNDPDTQRILSSLPGLDSRIRVLTNRRSKGVSGARNTGMDEAQSAWLAFLDSDDLWLPTALAARWRAILDHPAATWVSGPLLRLYHPGSESLRRNNDTPLSDGGIEYIPLSERAPYLYSLIHDTYETGEVSVLPRPVEHILGRDMITTSGVMIGRTDSVRALRFSETLNTQEDLHLYLRLAATEDLYYIPTDVFLYRIRSGSLIHNPDYCEAATKWNMLSMLEHQPELNEFRAKIREQMETCLDGAIYFYRKHGRRSKAVRYSLFYAKTAPYKLKPWKQLVASFL